MCGSIKTNGAPQQFHWPPQHDDGMAMLDPLADVPCNVASCPAQFGLSASAVTELPRHRREFLSLREAFSEKAEVRSRV